MQSTFHFTMFTEQTPKEVSRIHRCVMNNKVASGYTGQPANQKTRKQNQKTGTKHNRKCEATNEGTALERHWTTRYEVHQDNCH